MRSSEGRTMRLSPGQTVFACSNQTERIHIQGRVQVIIQGAREALITNGCNLVVTSDEIIRFLAIEEITMTRSRLRGE